MVVNNWHYLRHWENMQKIGAHDNNNNCDNDDDDDVVV